MLNFSFDLRMQQYTEQQRNNEDNKETQPAVADYHMICKFVVEQNTARAQTIIIIFGQYRRG